MSTHSSFEQDQQLFADTLLKIQIHSALAKEHAQNKKSPLPLLAQSCSILDNLPQSASPHWTDAQRRLISSLKIDAWVAFSDACIESKDWIQAEASLQRLCTLLEIAAGPLSLRAKRIVSNKQVNNRDKEAGSTNHTSIPAADPVLMPSDLGTSPPTLATASVSKPLDTNPTEEQCQAALRLIETWGKLRQVYEDMGKADMANNFTKRIEKMRKRLEDVHPKMEQVQGNK
ncbi:hypothetical protein BGZ70_002109 [Mortierella alpina]|uniref:Uncharacterized protein n=1 Tax=Mortierella alpina TaxID=64518 RepID=A0A9P6JEW3_MORAP|nr:hypothetical protein BGZ70_002109 [Mortierella alpina]